MPDDAAPLSGIRVLDLSRLLPGPYCSLLLAQLGAEVIKVETPLAGDYARMAPAEAGFGGVFEALNRGKRSIAVDYRKPRGRDLLLTAGRDGRRVPRVIPARPARPLRPGRVGAPRHQPRASCTAPSPATDSPAHTATGPATTSTISR